MRETKNKKILLQKPRNENSETRRGRENKYQVNQSEKKIDQIVQQENSHVILMWQLCQKTWVFAQFPSCLSRSLIIDSHTNFYFSPILKTWANSVWTVLHSSQQVGSDASPGFDLGTAPSHCCNTWAHSCTCWGPQESWGIFLSRQRSLGFSTWEHSLIGGCRPCSLIYSLPRDWGGGSLSCSEHAWGCLETIAFPVFRVEVRIIKLLKGKNHVFFISVHIG